MTTIGSPVPSTRRYARGVRGERGQAAVEFALVVPLICFLVWALVQFAIGVNYWLDATHLANEGARLGATLGNQTPPGGSTLACYIKNGAESSELRNGTGDVSQAAQVQIAFPNGTAVGQPVQVTVTAKYKWIPFIGGGTFNIKGTSTMRLEQVPTYNAASC
jgi:Flp pilus assembly protein TadG